MRRFSSTLLWQRLGGFISQYEKVLLALLSVAIVISGTFWFKQYSHSQSGQPSPGGTYVEGIVGSRVDVEAIAAKITKAGLFTLNDAGELTNLLVEKWEVNSDATEYKFTLAAGVNPEEIRNSLEANSDVLDQAAVTADGQVITLTLPKPNADLPLILTQPFFDYGPYKVSKITSKTTILTRNTRQMAVAGYLNKIIIHTFDDEAALAQAVAKHQVDGAVLTDNQERNDFPTQTISLPRYYALIFNVNQTPFRDADFRHQVIDNHGPSSKTFRLTTTNTEPYLTLANNLVAAWNTAGFSVTLDARSTEEISQKTAPSRDFQVLLTGISYGSELDPYYLWHSSQIRPPGNNLSGVKSDPIDALIAKIQTAYTIPDRASLIDQLHSELKTEGIAVILQQDSAHFVLSKNIHFSQPFLPISINDRWQSIARWYAR